MAGTHITSGTTTANVVTRLTFGYYRGLEVVNRSSGDMWARFDGVDPTIAGDDCFFIPAQSFIEVNNPKLAPEPAIGQTSSSDVRLISGAAANFTVSAGV